MISPASFDVRLAGAKMIAPSVRQLVFERVDGGVFDFAPGQWVNLVLPLASGEIKRAYSIASPPLGTPRFELAVTRVENGPGSVFLHGLGEGETLRAIGPHGFFTHDERDAPSLFVATGTGITPLRSMLLAAVNGGLTAPIWVLFGARFEQDILYREELEALAREAKDGQIRYDITLSRGEEAWTGRRGYVQAHVPELFQALRAASGAAPHVYICGLDRMVSAVKDLCRNELGAHRKQVHVERYD